MKHCPVCKGVVSPDFQLSDFEDKTISTLDAFLHDVAEGESELTELFNVVGYNELKLMVDRAKAFATVMESYARVTTNMDKEYLEVKKELDELKKFKANAETLFQRQKLGFSKNEEDKKFIHSELLKIIDLANDVCIDSQLIAELLKLSDRVKYGRRISTKPGVSGTPLME